MYNQSMEPLVKELFNFIMFSVDEYGKQIHLSQNEITTFWWICRHLTTTDPSDGSHSNFRKTGISKILKERRPDLYDPILHWFDTAEAVTKARNKAWRTAWKRKVAESKASS